MTDLELLKEAIDETNYPYFTDEYLQGKINDTGNVYEAAKELCLVKAGIGELKLGDVTIPSPRDHFMLLSKQISRRSRLNQTRVVVRYDEQP